MSLVTFKILCSQGHEFQAVGPSKGEYGDFVMYGEHGDEPTLLSALDDAAYEEVAELLRAHFFPNDGEAGRQLADAIQRIFGVACDPAPDGTRLKIGFRPCPSCGTRKLTSWSPTAPYTGDVLQLTHDAWDAATAAQKLAWLTTAVEADTTPEK